MSYSKQTGIAALLGRPLKDMTDEELMELVRDGRQSRAFLMETSLESSRASKARKSSATAARSKLSAEELSALDAEDL